MQRRFLSSKSRERIPRKPWQRKLARKKPLKKPLRLRERLNRKPKLRPKVRAKLKARVRANPLRLRTKSSKKLKITRRRREEPKPTKRWRTRGRRVLTRPKPRRMPTPMLERKLRMLNPSPRELRSNLSVEAASPRAKVRLRPVRTSLSQQTKIPSPRTSESLLIQTSEGDVAPFFPILHKLD